MKSPIKIIKRQRGDDSNTVKTCEVEKSVEQSTREMASTVKSWITELQDRKRAERHSLSQLLSHPVSG